MHPISIPHFATTIMLFQKNSLETSLQKECIFKTEQRHKNVRCRLYNLADIKFENGNRYFNQQGQNTEINFLLYLFYLSSIIWNNFLYFWMHIFVNKKQKTFISDVHCKHAFRVMSYVELDIVQPWSIIVIMFTSTLLNLRYFSSLQEFLIWQINVNEK